ncbi:MAG: DUF962 domain-containing protein [Saprospiraceae bacterium]|nr:DUF962 domain-containing protein [Saprospiraceae bacterium]
MNKKYSTLKEFYPYYLTEHQHPTSRALHFIGTAGLITLLVYGLFVGPLWLVALVPVCGYGFAWVGHFFFEKNKPATFVYLGMSLISDFIMFWHILTGQLPKKLEEAKKIVG